MRFRARPGTGPAGSGSHPPPKRRRARSAANILIPILLSWAGSEALGQYWFGDPYNYSSYRFTYLSPDAFVTLDNGSWTYRPDTTVTETIVYKKPFGGYFAESTCDYPIDDVGFIGNPSGRRNYDVLLLGDSFTAGEAGCSWMPELRRRVPQLAIYNAGLAATGVENWAMSERYLLDRGFRFAHVVMIFIDNDFFRPLAGRNGEGAACLHDIARCTPRDYSYPLVAGMDLAAVSASRVHTRFRDEVDYWWMRNLWVSHFLIDSISRRWTGRPIAVSEATLTALRAIEADGGTLHLIKVSTKTEAALRADSAYSEVVDRMLATRGLTYDRCPIPYAEFFSYDAHPTARGYARLAACVSRIIGRYQPADGEATNRSR